MVTDQHESVTEQESLPAGLYVTATPIGNARDISLRALDVLSRADVIACEDTRVTSKLMAIHNIRTQLITYHDHNGEQMRPKLISRIEKGEAVVLVSDAGTPLISDPGYKLVRDLRDRGLPVTAVPGASSVLTALTLSGLPSDRFLFLGFLPSRSGARVHALEDVKSVQATLVFLESAPRLAKSLADMSSVLGHREAAVAREMTKRFEEVRRASIAELSEHYEVEGPPKGEICIVVGPPDPESNQPSEEDLKNRLKHLLTTYRVKDAATELARQTGLPRRDLYKMAQDISDDQKQN